MSIPHIEHALDHIESACQKRLSSLYPTGVPAEIQKRYEDELQLLKRSDHIDDFELFRLFSAEAKKCCALFNGRGTVMGSLIYYLLGENCFNPFQAHYYCPDCGYFEIVDTNLYGMDLPSRHCPICQKEIWADGFNLPAESVFGLDGRKMIAFEFNASSDFKPFVKKVLETIYPDNPIVPWGMFQLDETTVGPHIANKVIGVSLVGFAILPHGNTLDDYSDMLSYLEDGTPCISGGGWDLEQSMIKPIRLLNSDYVDKLVLLQRATGIYANEIAPNTLRNITWSNIFHTAAITSKAQSLFYDFKPRTFRDMVALECATHSTFSWNKEYADGLDPRGFENMINTDAFKKYPCYTREDFYKHLLSAGVERKTAFEASELIRKGRACAGRSPESFMTLPIPEEIKEIAANYLYIFPEAHCIEYMLIYAKLAYYAKIDSKAFYKINYKKK